MTQLIQPNTRTGAQGKTIRAAIYTRISFDDTKREEGVERQEHDCRKWAAANGWNVVAHYSDNSISASKFDVERPQYDLLCAAVLTGEVNAVIVWDVDRLTRQQGQLEWWLDMARRGRVTLADAKGGVIRTDTAEDRMVASIRGVFSKFEVDHKSERQVAANKARARTGRFFTGRRPTGLRRELFLDDDGVLQVARVIPEEAEAVRCVYRAYLEGHTLDAIARAPSGEREPGLGYMPCLPRPAHTQMLEFNQRHPDRPIDVEALRRVDPEKAKVYDPQPWNAATVSLMLRNPKYAGYVGYTPTSKSRRFGDGTAKWYSELYVDEDTGEYVRGAWEQIVDDETWWRAQEKLRAAADRVAAQPPKTRKHIGSGIFRCGVCGHTLHIQGGRNGSYVCPNNKHHPRVEGDPATGPVCVVTRLLDPIIERCVESFLTRADVAEGIDTTRKPAGEHRDFEAELDELKAAREKAGRDYAAGLIEAEDLKARREFIDAQMAKVSHERRETEAASRVPVLPEDVAASPDPAQAFRDADLAVRRAVVDYLLEVRVMPCTKKGGIHNGKRGGWFDPTRIKVFAKTPDGLVPIELSAEEEDAA